MIMSSFQSFHSLRVKTLARLSLTSIQQTCKRKFQHSQGRFQLLKLSKRKVSSMSRSKSNSKKSKSRIFLICLLHLPLRKLYLPQFIIETSKSKMKFQLKFQRPSRLLLNKRQRRPRSPAIALKKSYRGHHQLRARRELLSRESLIWKLKLSQKRRRKLRKLHRDPPKFKKRARRGTAAEQRRVWISLTYAKVLVLFQISGTMDSLRKENQNWVRKSIHLWNNLFLKKRTKVSRF